MMDPDARLVEDLRSRNVHSDVTDLLSGVKRWIVTHHRVPLQDAEDLASEVLVRAAGRIDSFTGSSLFFTWVTGIAGKVVLEYLRKTQRDIDFYGDGDVSMAATTVDDPEEVALRNLVAEEALASLNESQRTVVRLRLEEGLDSAEIGARMGKSPGAVRSILSGALASLERHRQSEGY